jgi:hypothetical protein
MKTRAKLYIASYTASLMMLANVFSKPLHIPEPLTWVLLIGVFIPLSLTFRFIKQLKLEAQAQPLPAVASGRPATDPQRIAQRNLILVAVVGSAGGLCSPLWLPLTGTTLGTLGDFICGIITAAVVCAIAAFRWKQL